MILAAITLFNPEKERILDNIASIVTQVDGVLCVDNHSKNYAGIKADILERFPNTAFVENPKNEGIAKALNQMFEYAKDNGFDYVLTLDQDSVCPDNIIEEFSKHLDLEGLGTLCPRTADRNFTEDMTSSEPLTYMDKCITSASLTPVSVWEKVGGFDEKLFIDFVDHDLCARLVENRLNIVRVNAVVLLHELGHGRKISILGKSLTVLNHSAFRKYYMVRNRLYYMERYRDIIDVKAEKKKYYILYVKTFLFEKHRVKKLQAMLRGRRDGKKMVKELRRK